MLTFLQWLKEATDVIEPDPSQRRAVLNQGDFGTTSGKKVSQKPPRGMNIVPRKDVFNVNDKFNVSVSEDPYEGAKYTLQNDNLSVFIKFPHVYADEHGIANLEVDLSVNHDFHGEEQIKQLPNVLRTLAQPLADKIKRIIVSYYKQKFDDVKYLIGSPEDIKAFALKINAFREIVDSGCFQKVTASTNAIGKAISGGFFPVGKKDCGAYSSLHHCIQHFAKKEGMMDAGEIDWRTQETTPEDFYAA